MRVVTQGHDILDLGDHRTALKTEKTSEPKATLTYKVNTAIKGGMEAARENWIEDQRRHRRGTDTK